MWVTFYPATTLAALYGGWVCGTACAGGSCLVALYGWRYFVDQPFIADYGDRLGLVAFLLNCAVIVAVADMARRGRAQALRARDAAEAASRAKSAFLASMSHELRTPLNAILGFSSLLQGDETLTDQQRRTLGIISRSGDHLLGLIDSVLDLARIEAGRGALQCAQLDLHALAQGVTEMVGQRAQSKGLRLSLEVAAGCPRAITSDEGRLRQVITNLLGNAVKYTNEGEVTLRAAAQAAEGPGDYTLLVEVADTGPGIAPEDHARIFEPFVQAHPGSGLEGAGLGLSIVRQSVEFMGGAVTVQSEPGQGATFRVEIPVRAADGEAVPASAGRAAGRFRLAPGEPRYRVLIADDQPENTLLLRSILEEVGFEVAEAANGAEAVRTFTDWHPHFIWMDWRMPVMDGLDATRSIRALEGGKDVRIAVLSASVLPTEQQQVLAAGADGYVAKPYGVPALCAVMSEQLGVRIEPVGEETESGEDDAAPVDPQALSALPEALRLEMTSALVALDTGRISAAVERIAEVEPGLAAALAACVRRRRYSALWSALEAGAQAP